MATSPQDACRYFDVIKDERRATSPSPSGIRGRTEESRREQTGERGLGPGSPIGLALSGGGIRSATFSLGVLQALANRGYLSRFDYMSTVSGGGYIGSWLSAWIHRTSLAEVCSKLGRADIQGSAQSSHSEPLEITWLRRYSNYLTPRLGLFSADSLTLITTWLRNVFLNLVVLVAFLVTLFLIPRLLLLLVAGAVNSSGAFGYAAALVGFLFVAGIQFNLWQQASLGHAATARNDGDADGKYAVGGTSDVWVMTGQGVLITVVIPGVLAAFLAAIWLFATKAFEPAEDWRKAFVLIAVLLLVAGIPSLLNAFLSRRQKLLSALWDNAVYAGAAAISVGAGTVLLVSARKYYGNLGSLNDLPKLLTVGPSVFLVAFGIVGSLFVGLTGRAYREPSREWWSRMNAGLLTLGLGWFVLSAAAFYAEPVVRWAFQRGHGWLQATLGSAWVASLFTSLFVKKPRDAKPATQATVDSIVTTAASIFVVGLLVLVAAGTSAVLNAGAASEPTQVKNALATKRAAEMVSKQPWLGPVPEAAKVAPILSDYVRAHVTDLHRQAQADVIVNRDAPGDKHASTISFALSSVACAATTDMCTGNYLYVAMGLTLLVLGVFSWRVDVNKFSLHNMYKNRLVRCYLGATNRHRDAQPFTGFDESDDLQLAALAENRPRGEDDTRAPIRLFHIINTAMNLSQGRNLAWQERKAASFVLTPIYCGFELARTQGDSTDRHTTDNLSEIPGYRKTEYYAAGRYGAAAHKLTGQEDCGFTLGMAMTTSGAAASPNMGRGTRPALAFLLTIFNVRLGRWSSNPARGRWWSSSPHFGLLCLLMELLGYSNEERDFVYLSDGGHFENLGIYELVRRRCRLIVAVDAAADPMRKFGDLGDAIRKCRVDFGVEIDLPLKALRGNPRTMRSAEGYAWGEIRYRPDVADGPVGHILYIKPSLREERDEPDDIGAYGATNPAFPQQTTADQFFDESQFESYRRLGSWIASRALADPNSTWLPHPELLLPVERQQPSPEEAKPLRIGRWALIFGGVAFCAILLLRTTQVPISDFGLGHDCVKELEVVNAWPFEAGPRAQACAFLAQQDPTEGRWWMLGDCLTVVAYTTFFILAYAWAFGFNRGNPPTGRRRWAIIVLSLIAVAGACTDYLENVLLLDGLSNQTLPEVERVARNVAPISVLKFLFAGLNLLLVAVLCLFRNQLRRRPAIAVPGVPIGPSGQLRTETGHDARDEPPKDDPFLYFAYGSNMLSLRLRATNRAPSATFADIGYVTEHRLTFDKVSDDGSGKCDIEFTGDRSNRVYGVLYRIAKKDLRRLDRAEGLGRGYDSKKVAVVMSEASSEARTYTATLKDLSVRPYHWYKRLAIAGAEEHRLPRDYVDWMRTVASQADSDNERTQANEELLIQSLKGRLEAVGRLR